MTERWLQFNTWIAERRVKIKDAAINVRRAFLLVWQAHPPSALAMLGCTLIGAFLPVGQAWVGKLIVDAVVKGINGHIGAEAGLRAVLPYLAAEFILLVTQAANSQARTLAEHVLHAQINLSINTRIIRKALEKAKGSKTKAASLLGVSFPSLRHRIEKLNMENGEGEGEEK